MNLLTVYWNANPEIFSIGSFRLGYYGVLFVSGFLIGFIMMKGFFKREGMPLVLLDSLLYTLLISATIGARLMHCFAYQPDYYLAHPWEILMIWKGGLASHGGVIGILIGIWFYVKKYGKKNGFDYIWLLDRICIPTALASCLIRLGNLMNSEIYGVETSLPWGFVFLQNGETVPKHPTQLYEALAYLLTFFLLWGLYKWCLPKMKKGMFVGLLLALVFTSRFFIEFVKNPQVEFEKGMALDMGQWLSIPFILIGWGLFFYALKYGKPAMLPAKQAGSKMPPVKGKK